MCVTHVIYVWVLEGQTQMTCPLTHTCVVTFVVHDESALPLNTWPVPQSCADLMSARRCSTDSFAERLVAYAAIEGIFFSGRCPPVLTHFSTLISVQYSVQYIPLPPILMPYHLNIL